MADYFTQFSCFLDVGSSDNANRADDIRRQLSVELEQDEGVAAGFVVDVDHQSGPGVLWIHSDEFGEPEHVIRFVLRLAEDLDLAGVWGFTWSHSCSKPRVDAFGGGAHVLDLGARRSVADIDCGSFVAEQLAQHDSASATGGAP